MSKKYEELDFTDNFFFCKILMKNKKLCIELLELILKIKIKDIVFMAEQKPIEITADGRGVRLDVYVEDEADTVYDIEMQPTMQSNLPKRSRYYQGMIDLNLIERGADFNELKKSYVIFICLEDPFDKGLHIYTFENRCKEFLDYLQGKGTKSDFTRRIDEEVVKARTHAEWRVEYMSLILRDHEKREEGRAEGREEGREEKARVVVMNMLKENLPIDTICRIAECDEAFVAEVRKSALQ